MKEDEGTFDFADPLVPSVSEAHSRAQGWSDQPVEVSVATRLEAMISVRLDADAALAVRKAARLTGMTRSEFVRRAAIAEARRIVDSAAQPSIIVTQVDRVRATVATGGAHEENASALDAEALRIIEYSSLSAVTAGAD